MDLLVTRKAPNSKSVKLQVKFSLSFDIHEELYRDAPGPIRPRDAPPLSLHLNYRNYCAIISRALI